MSSIKNVLNVCYMVHMGGWKEQKTLFLTSEGSPSSWRDRWFHILLLHCDQGTEVVKSLDSAVKLPGYEYYFYFRAV